VLLCSKATTVAGVCLGWTEPNQTESNRFESGFASHPLCIRIHIRRARIHRKESRVRLFLCFAIQDTHTPIGFQPSLHTHTHTRIFADADVTVFSPSVSVSSLRLSIDRSIGRRVCASSSNERIEFHFFFNSFIHDGREDDRADVVGGVSWFETMRLGGCAASVSRVVAMRARRAGESGETGRSRRRRRILSTRRRRERRRRRDDDDGFSVRKR
jgi:hypothetical protein